jgi:transglutaminase/protease-like cytokinesis protein 3
MKLLLTSLLLCITFTTSQAQNFDVVDNKVRLYPKRYASADALATQIEKDFTKDIDKVRAVYTWLALNISYDLETLYNGETQINFSYTDQEDLQQKLKAINTHTINKTLRTKKAICEGYAQTFKRVSELLGIPCLLVGGYSKGDVSDIGNTPQQENHAWNAVKINRKWYLVDATWGSGYTNAYKWVQQFNDTFFFTNPDEFILTHLPSEPEFSFTNNSVSKKEFYNAPLYEKAFFRNNLELFSPLKGVLRVKPNSLIEFTLGNVSENIELYYAFKGNQFSNKIEPNCIDKKCVFKIPFTENKNTELLIFANKRTALQYKIKIEK